MQLTRQIKNYTYIVLILHLQAGFKHEKLTKTEIKLVS